MHFLKICFHYSASRAQRKGRMEEKRCSSCLHTNDAERVFLLCRRGDTDVLAKTCNCPYY